MQRPVVLLSLVIACSGGRGGTDPAIPTASCPGLDAALSQAETPEATVEAIARSCGGDLPTALRDWASGTSPQPDLAAVWVHACPGLTLDELGLAPDSPGTRRRVAEACGTTRLSAERIVWGTGRPVLALAFGAWAEASSIGGDIPTRIIERIAGQAALDAPIDLDLPTAAGGEPLVGDRPTVVLDGNGLRAGEGRLSLAEVDDAPLDLGGPWAGHRIRALGGKLPASFILAASRDTPMGRIERVLASSGEAGAEVRVATTSGRAHGLSLLLPGDEEPAVHVRLRNRGLDVAIGGERIAPTVACTTPARHTVCHSVDVADRLGDPEQVDVVAAAYDLAGLRRVLEGKDLSSVRLDVPDNLPLQVFVTVAATLRDLGATVELDLTFAPCLTPPQGMACVPGGPALVGSDAGPTEAPLREIEVSTFYIDTSEVTVAEFEACREAGYCRGKRSVPKRDRAALAGTDQPAVGMNWNQARQVCTFQGKRLVSEWEWEKAARGPDGDTYPWGDSAPSCEDAHSRACATDDCGGRSPWTCSDYATHPVSKGRAGHFGLVGMAGNAFEWTETWGVRSPGDAQALAGGRDPRGPCDGAPKCREQGTKVLRGGSWRDPADALRGSSRRLAEPDAPQTTASTRCGSTDPFLASRNPTGPAVAVAAPTRAEPALQALFEGIEEDPLKPICGEEVRATWVDKLKKGGRSTTECRDVYSYVKPNEPRGHVWRDLIRNRGGAYVGVASDQNYTYAAIARAQWVWLMDYDPIVVRLHQVLEPLILAAESPSAFVALWQGDAEPAEAALRAHFGDDAERFVTFYGLYKNTLAKYYAREAGKHPEGIDDFGWLRNPEQYGYIRTLHQQGRIHAVKGDMLGDVTMVEIGKAARAMGVPVRVYYTSNAPTAWGGLTTPAYRRNVRGLPMDEHSIVLQTLNSGGFAQTGYWHHSVQWGLEQQRRLGLENGYRNASHLVWDRLPGTDGDLTHNGLP